VTAALLSTHDLFYGGGWQPPIAGSRALTHSPSTGAPLAEVADATSADVDAAVRAARSGFLIWRDTPPAERARILRETAARIRANASELAAIDAADGGNPVEHLEHFAEVAAGSVDFFAGLVTEMKGTTIPMGPGRMNLSVREPFGVVARIVAFNHPLMFAVTRMAAPLAAGNALILKPSDQTPLSALRLASLVGDLFPAGVFNVLTGGREAGAALSVHPDIAMITLIGSVGTGKAIMKAAADTLKPVLFELGGKNALIACPDADPDAVADAAIAGMNFTWAGQSCGSTSRAYIHDDIHDAVTARLAERLQSLHPGLPTERGTRMGAIVSKAQRDRILDFIHSAKEEGAQLISGGMIPNDPALGNGWFVLPTAFSGVTSDMRVAREEIFGPVLSILRWRDEAEMLEAVNGTDFGLTGSIWTRDIDRALRLAGRVEAGYVWINEVGKHFAGTNFGGYKQSGIGREEGLEELLAFTQQKNIHVRFQGNSK